MGVKKVAQWLIHSGYIGTIAGLIGWIAYDANTTTELAINGPRGAVAGELVTLTHTADDAIWIHQQQAHECDKSIAFVAQPGKHIVYLAGNTASGLQYTSHVLEVGPFVKPPDGPRIDEPAEPIDEPAYDVSSIVGQARGLGDRDTELLLVQEWQRAIESIRKAPTLQQAGEYLRQANESAFAQRTSFSSRYKDWLGQFRKPLNDDIAQLVKSGAIQTPSNLATYVESLIDALQ